VNDAKRRKDHEESTTFKQFWVDLALLVNSDDYEEDDPSSLPLDSSTDSSGDSQPDNGSVPISKLLPFPEHWKTVWDVGLVMDGNGGDLNLSVFSQQTPSSVFLRVQTLFKLRRKMLQDIETSGNHSSDPWSFVDNALKQTKSTENFGRIETVYFFILCELNPEVDSSFQPFLSESSKGSSDVVPLLEDSSPHNQSKKDKAEAYLAQSVATGKSLLKQMETNTEIRREERDIRREELILKKRMHLQETMNQILQNMMNPACPEPVKDSLLAQWNKLDDELKSLPE
jgi:hypothetical protein